MGPTIIALVIAAVFLILGIVMLSELRDTDILTSGTTRTVNIEQLSTVVNDTGVLLQQRNNTNAANPSMINCTNSTYVIPSANYTLTTGSWRLSYSAPVDLGDVNNSYWNCSYSYTSSDEAYASANTTLVGLGTFGDFWEIIVLAVVISIVIALLLIAFGGRRNR